MAMKMHLTFPLPNLPIDLAGENAKPLAAEEGDRCTTTMLAANRFPLYPQAVFRRPIESRLS